MKNMILGIAAALSAACTPALKVDVANTTQIERDDETVEIAWSEVAALEGATPENIVVLNDDNEQIPSQVLFRGGTEPAGADLPDRRRPDGKQAVQTGHRPARELPRERSAARFPNVTTTTPGRTTR